MQDGTNTLGRPTAPPPFWASVLICSVMVGLVGWLRLVVFVDHIVPLGASLVLLLCLWNRSVALLYGMAVAFTLITFFKVYGVMPHLEAKGSQHEVLAEIQIWELWVLTVVLHGLLRALASVRQKQRKLEEINAELGGQNAALQRLNAKLISNDEEISRQNEELQSQTEELEQQSEELRQQAEEMEHQGTLLQETNVRLGQREKGMQTLLDSGRWLRSGLNEDLVMNGICQAATQVMGSEVTAAAVVECGPQDSMVLRGDAGFGINGPMPPKVAFAESFAALILERGETGFIQDLQDRADLNVPRPAVGRPFASVLASPIWVDGKPVASLEIYSSQPRHWNEQEHQVAEWLAAQAALSLQAVHFHKQLELRRNHAEEASLQKTAFLAAVSHDVRTPANAICLLAELIERTIDDPSKRDMVRDMVRNLSSNARSLIELVSDVLDLARFDAGRMDLQISDFSLGDLLRAEVRQALPVAENKGLTLSESPPACDIWLRSDRMKLARVLSNLIGNAVKFTNVGSVTLECGLAGNGDVLLDVADTGVGIPVDVQPRIFDEFFQLRNPERDREKGTGLGLAICRRLLDGLGCQIVVASEEGAGTTFTVCIPAALTITPPRETLPLPPLAPRDPTALQGLRILLVEDHDVTREATSLLIASMGAIVSQARTGREALQLLNHDPHEVMLLDLNLPDIHGTEILRRLQISRPIELRHIFAVSGDVRPERIAEVKFLGADDLIPKPLGIEVLLAALHATRARPATAAATLL
jgi:signal transduction histidine kinase/ActR/RegA family two-component response regulator